VGEIVVANRTPGRGEALAERVGGRAIGLDDIPAALAGADVVLSSTSADHVLIERADVEDAMRRRDDRAMLVVDVAVPRDVDPGVAQVFGVTLLDIDALRALGEQSLQQRRAEIGRVREIIADELERYRIDRSAREVAPLVTALRTRIEELRVSELERLGGELADDPTMRATLDAVTRGLVNKLLHEPTVRLKDAAGTARGDLFADALVELFALQQPSDDE
jgi:glutamyl-tRNA reductase